MTKYLFLHEEKLGHTLVHICHHFHQYRPRRCRLSLASAERGRDLVNTLSMYCTVRESKVIYIVIKRYLTTTGGIVTHANLSLFARRRPFQQIVFATHVFTTALAGIQTVRESAVLQSQRVGAFSPSYCRAAVSRRHSPLLNPKTERPFRELHPQLPSGYPPARWAIAQQQCSAERGVGKPAAGVSQELHKGAAFSMGSTSNAKY